MVDIIATSQSIDGLAEGLADVPVPIGVPVASDGASVTFGAGELSRAFPVGEPVDEETDVGDPVVPVVVGAPEVGAPVVPPAVGDPVEVDAAVVLDTLGDPVVPGDVVGLAVSDPSLPVG